MRKLISYILVTQMPTILRTFSKNPKYVRALVVVIHIQFIKTFVHKDTQNSHMTEILRLVYHRTLVVIDEVL